LDSAEFIEALAADEVFVFLMRSIYVKYVNIFSVLSADPLDS
jgi:hypothetical protein